MSRALPSIMVLMHRKNAPKPPGGRYHRHAVWGFAMRKLILVLSLAASAAVAQTPARSPAPTDVETVYSDAQREQDQTLSRRFIQSLLAPSVTLEGQYTRWKYPACPHVVGLAPLAAYQVEQRIREVADKIGAPRERR